MTMDDLDGLVSQGQLLLDMRDATRTHGAFNTWVSAVGTWLKEIAPNTGLYAEWASKGTSSLVVGHHYNDTPTTWSLFHSQVQLRLLWLSSLPAKLQLASSRGSLPFTTPTNISDRQQTKLQTRSGNYVSPDRISELKGLAQRRFDLTKLVQLCEELNISFEHKCYLSLILLTRALLDHIPPIFGSKSFTEVANNYAGTKSFKESMRNLDTSSRNIADAQLHTQIRKSESLPNFTQVDFSNDLDVLLAEIVRVLK